MHPYRPGIRVGTDWGHLCLFGYDPAPYYSGRGSIEAASAGIRLQEGDVAFRGNLATVDDGLTVVDRRAGRIRDSGEIDTLLRCVDGMQLDGVEFLVRHLTQHRVAVVMRGEGLHADVPDTDPGTAREGSRVVNPLDTGTDSRPGRSADLLWRFLLEVKKRWDGHPVNQARVKRGLLPANFILTRGCGSAMVLPDIHRQFPGVRIACIAGDATILGIARMCGFDGAFTRPSFTGGFETDYEGKAALALEKLSEYDLVVVHVKATDLCGHDDMPEKKARVIEHIDRMFEIWDGHTDRARTYLAMTADHSTPCHFRDHTADPVPTFLCGPHVRRDECTHFGEQESYRGLLNNYTGSGLMGTLMDFLGHTRKYGA